MKNKLLFLTKESLKKKMKTKWFYVANILIALLIIGVINIDSIITFFGGNFNEPTEILVIDNTNNTYSTLKDYFEGSIEYLKEGKNVIISEYTNTKEEAKKEVKEDDKVLLIINHDTENFINAEVITNQGMDAIILQILTTNLNQIKSEETLEHFGITNDMLSKIEKPIVIENTKLDESKTTDELTELIMGVLFPIVILPFFMLTMFLVQMIGAEVNEEKTTKSMEIIISNVSPKTHFFSKIIAGNVFVLAQGLLLVMYAIVGVGLRFIYGGFNFNGELGTTINDIMVTLNEYNIISNLSTIIPLTLILMLLTFLSYSLISGILASMTTNMEDYQQIQTPIIVISLIGYYLSMMAAMFKGSLFIRVLSYIPCISALLSPALLLLGQIKIYDVLIAILLLIICNYLLIKYGLKIYKIGILNYSSNKLWKKIFKAAKK